MQQHLHPHGWLRRPGRRQQRAGCRQRVGPVAEQVTRVTQVEQDGQPGGVVDDPRRPVGQLHRAQHRTGEHQTQQGRRGGLGGQPASSGDVAGGVPHQSKSHRPRQRPQARPARTTAPTAASAAGPGPCPYAASGNASATCAATT